MSAHAANLAVNSGQARRCEFFSARVTRNLLKSPVSVEKIMVKIMHFSTPTRVHTVQNRAQALHQ
jgi:hypothetical protein